ncbi:MAG TPA: GAF and ANTAR domain-containing protein [Actinophytocola sp.]|uniref:GAF and ANTAR domain-containing protein n=1 Tax=Actinophytocola sp. TaxID=1872138 RepID=UPI002DB6DF9D|nr:GAF and ANTAR domain-containing protein [Actinophytocola sp.]HEU5469522.1 GAF and ANTAR domain-containing protein [Actinophytocola sp.]
MSSPRVNEILSRVVEGRGSDSSLPARLCAECLSALPVSGVALALMTEDGPSGVVLAATDARARQLEELQFALDEGPCVEASRGDHPVLHPELTASGSARWPRYGVAALDAGVHAIFSFPLRVGAVRIGVLDLYRDTPGHLTTPELADAAAFADAAIVVLLYLQDHPGPDGERSALTGPIDSRAEVHQATGMITIQLGVSLTEALLRLRAYAYECGQTVTDVAADVVARRLRFDDGGPARGSDIATANQ